MRHFILFIALLVNGLLGGAVGFQISDNMDFNYGLKYKFDQLVFNTTYDNSHNVTRTSFMMHHVNGFGTYSINDSETFKAVLEGGLSFYKYKRSNLQPSFFGFNISPGLNLEFRNQFYLFLNYSFIKTKLKRRQTGFIENEKMNTVRLGVGFKL